MITIWYKVLFKTRVSFDGLVSRKKVFSESSHRIETHIEVSVEVIEVQINVAFKLCLDEDLIEFLRADIMFESPHLNNFCRISTFQLRSLLVNR